MKVQAGMTVLAADGLSVGHVTQVGEAQETFLLERPGGSEHTIFVPFEAIQAIVLDVPADQVSRQGWEAVTTTGAGT